jgi:tetratricopeptide (TPR) repeat protein
VFVEDRQFEAAKSSFEQAYQLDNRSVLVNEQLQQVNQLIIDRDYSLAMSSGYKKLQQNKYNQALVFFNQAKQIKPTSAPAVQAIKQSKNERMQANISFKFEQAQGRIQQEDWSKALDKYNEILLIDKSLLQAQIGLLKSTARLTLSDQLNNYIEHPERLSNKNVYQQALLTKKDAMNIKHPGEKLLQQINSINQLMVKAKIPLLVTIESDNQTMVTLYRSGQLGKFTEKELSLTPGEYTLVGSRDGFRDVRQAFILYADESHPTIVIQCRERVTRG